MVPAWSPQSDGMMVRPPNTGVQRMSLPPSLFELRRTSRSTALGAGALAKAADAESLGAPSECP